MSDLTYEKLKKRVSDGLNARRREFHKTVEDICVNFRNLGLETAVWHPDKIHSVNIGGIDADSYVGYSRIEGKWGLIIRTIEHDHESRAYAGQRVYTLESCGNVEIVANALKKVRELIRSIHVATEHQVKILSQPDGDIEQLRNPECRF